MKIVCWKRRKGKLRKRWEIRKSKWQLNKRKFVNVDKIIINWQNNWHN